MALYIDTEMPESCFNCKFPRACKAITRRIDEMDKAKWFPNDHRHSDCPIIEIPEPHGRLIDADLIMKKLKESCRTVFGDDGDIPECSGLSIVSDYIESAPTVIPASESEERPAFLPTYELTPRKTNADRIRRMSDKELAELLVSTDGDFPPNCEDVPVRKLEAYWLDWLRQEAGNG